jgi:hypothetical protein
VALRPLRHNATFFAVDVDELPRARPQLAARLLAGIRDRVEAGTFRPLPHADHSAANVEAAFRTLQASAQIGKLVLRPPVARPDVATRPALQLAARGTVLVLGGTQGFGLATARFLAGQGVRHLALVSRRGAATPGAPAANRATRTSSKPPLRLKRPCWPACELVQRVLMPALSLSSRVRPRAAPAASHRPPGHSPPGAVA